MIYTAIDNFYLTDEQLQNSPSRKDGIEEAIETTLRIYGCDLIQEDLKLSWPLVRFYFIASIARSRLHASMSR
uniref:Cyclin-L1-1-like n=1 Tax=Rhizophora mucronata TaxID=61149 RepID=A0A2P2JYE7_RHIMU